MYEKDLEGWWLHEHPSAFVKSKSGRCYWGSVSSDSGSSRVSTSLETSQQQQDPKDSTGSKV